MGQTTAESGLVDNTTVYSSMKANAKSCVNADESFIAVPIVNRSDKGKESENEWSD